MISRALLAQDTAPVEKLSIVILEGEGAINNIKARTAMQPIVQVTDENHKPVSGAAVIFGLPESGPGGTFAHGAHTLQLTTDSQGRAVMRGFHANKVTGKFQINVHAAYHGVETQAAIAQTNAALATGVGVGAGVISAKMIALIVVGGAAAAAGGAVAATHSGSSAPVAPSAPTTVTLGAGSVTHP